MIQEFQLRLTPQEASSEQNIRRVVARQKGIAEPQISHVRVLKRSIDARQRMVVVNVTVRVYIGEEPADEAFTRIDYHSVEGKPECIVVGAGPGGLFAALRLIELGIRPIVLERGKDVHERRKDIARISREHRVDPESNYSFGEGGAGAFSDGKLYTRSKKRGNSDRILNIFCQHGASTSILSDAHPHIGTDHLPRVIEAMRETIKRCGGEVHFQTRVTGLLIYNNKVEGVEAVTTLPAAALGESVAKQGNESKSESAEIEASELKTLERQFHGPVILATGHSARDMYRWLFEHQVHIEAKDLAIGVRLEHPAHIIDQIQYHSKEGKGLYLPTAEYSVVTQLDGRGVYSFCMCPGGTVVPAASGPEQVVVNGMSASLRNSPWSNSGMVVELHNDDVPLLAKELEARLSGISKNSSSFKDLAGTPLQMLALQEELERLCWQQGGCMQTAPAQRMDDFVNHRLSPTLPRSSYSPGLVSSPLHEWMPPFIASRLRNGFQFFGKTKRGFLTNEALMIAIETRTSAPVRILRNHETLQHVTIAGLFPCGEGAGYAGGIVSAGVDGERCAEMAAEYINKKHQ